MSARVSWHAGLAGASIAVALALPAHARRVVATGDGYIPSSRAVTSIASAAAHFANFAGVAGAYALAPTSGCAAKSSRAGLGHARRGRA